MSRTPARCGGGSLYPKIPDSHLPESFPESFPENLPESFPENLPENVPEKPPEKSGYFHFGKHLKKLKSTLYAYMISRFNYLCAD